MRARACPAHRARPGRRRPAPPASASARRARPTSAPRAPGFARGAARGETGQALRRNRRGRDEHRREQRAAHARVARTAPLQRQCRAAEAATGCQRARVAQRAGRPRSREHATPLALAARPSGLTSRSISAASSGSCVPSSEGFAAVESLAPGMRAPVTVARPPRSLTGFLAPPADTPMLPARRVRARRAGWRSSVGARCQRPSASRVRPRPPASTPRAPPSARRRPARLALRRRRAATPSTASSPSAATCGASAPTLSPTDVLSACSPPRTAPPQSGRCSRGG